VNIRSAAAIAVLSVSTLVMHAQEGYIVTLNGDTVKASFKWEERLTNPATIIAQTNVDPSFREYSPLEISAFSVDNKFYESAIVQVDKNPDGTIYAGKKEFSFYSDTIFLSRIVEGSKPLFHLYDQHGMDHFYIKNDSKHELLLYKSYTKPDEEDRLMRLYVKTYIDQLKAYFSDNLQIQPKVARTDFAYNKLVTLFNNYYATGRKGEKKAGGKKNKTFVEFGVVAGITLTKMALDDLDHSTSTYTRSFNPAGGISFDVYLRSRSNRVSFNNEIMYTSFESRKVSRTNQTNYYVQRDVTLGATYLKLYNMIRYRFPVKQSSVFVNAGMSNGMAMNVKNTSVEKVILNDEVQSEERNTALTEIRKHEFGFIAGTGIRVKRLSLELRYESANGMSPYNILRSHSTRFFALAGFRL
jgi:hypothetical protein